MTCLDVSEKMLEIAKENLGTKAEIWQANLAEPLFFEDQSFDFIVASLSMHYVKNWYPVFKEFYRVLRLGGKVIFSTHNPLMDFGYSPNKEYYKIELIETLWKNGRGDDFHVRYYRRPFNEIVTPVISAGFILESITEPQPIPQANEIYPEEYEFYCSNPCFIFIQAQK